MTNTKKKNIENYGDFACRAYRSYRRNHRYLLFGKE